ncbi:MAG TPA: PemK family transcriptional regulator [Cyanobacteria bacterium UBA11372]|nr:PemK family transcriptional regulator [Cyanobacteria bacterium UBA11372]HBE53180.1 PemK family transcriptional regulator [Cyanobacteria bacterium UBA11369]
MVTVTRGDVVLCDLNPVIGTEQAGIRPVVVLQIDRANAVSPHIIIAPFTSKIRRALLPSHVFVPAVVGGLSQDSVILGEQIRVIDKSRIIRVLGHLDDIYMEELAKALSTILGLPIYEENSQE